MFEMIIRPKKAEKKPWEMLFVGIFYASLSVLLVDWIFSADAILSKYSGMIIVTFCVMFTLPFMYYLFKFEEEKDEKVQGFFKILKIHSTAVKAFVWLFLGFIIAFSFWYIVLPNEFLFKAQIQTYCAINSPGDIENCVEQYELGKKPNVIAGNVTKIGRLMTIIENNTYVLIFTLVFSLIFGAGAIFILAWNASVIAAAIGIFSQYEIRNIPLGLARYMIHGIPEIVAYFVAALSGGIISVGVIRYGLKDKRFLRIISNSVTLLFVSIIILAGIIEVWVTPSIF
jgi:uncharacterized membrane protein SpoIIM required for sporulation